MTWQLRPWLFLLNAWFWLWSMPSRGWRWRVYLWLLGRAARCVDYEPTDAPGEEPW